ncbi:NADH:ubiquinone oxidoreductase 20.1kD subunit [Colletotrichum zoysiae]|uniref:NADH:ubiquinone oxidoreductase 20.1kD subunit n=1 Tax=Colletotrichum zoysiae TaxID=1216348 RepID=A0AAD9H967_9PEZI|nr:NADH:ubiquinone oxidoreductase 20.1kD subunit [Colletotrichum zoysiae]
MLSQRFARVSTIRGAAQAARRTPIVQQRTFFPPQINDRKVLEEKYPDYPTLSDAEDPGMNGGYINPPFIKRQFRDPHANWWDKQERRNFGEPVHEDHDLLGMFSPYEYNWTTTGKGLLQIGAFIVAFLGVCGVVAANYPDKPSYPREFPDGLERELGGASAVRARKAGDADP